MGPHPSGNDLSNDEEQFWRRFIQHSTVTDLSGYAKYTYREALLYASLRDNGSANPVASRCDWVGCIDLYTDELYLTELPPTGMITQPSFVSSTNRRKYSINK